MPIGYASFINLYKLIELDVLATDSDRIRRLFNYGFVYRQFILSYLQHLYWLKKNVR